MAMNKYNALEKRWLFLLLLVFTFVPSALWYASCNEYGPCGDPLDKGYTECMNKGEGEEEVARCTGQPSDSTHFIYCIGTFESEDDQALCTLDPLTGATRDFTTITDIVDDWKSIDDDCAILTESGCDETTETYSAKYGSAEIWIADTTVTDNVTLDGAASIYNIVGCSTASTITPSVGTVSDYTIKLDSGATGITFSTLTINGISDFSPTAPTNLEDYLESATIYVSSGSSRNTFDNVTLANNFSQGVLVKSGGDVTLSDVTFGSASAPTEEGYTATYGVWNEGGLTAENLHFAGATSDSVYDYPVGSAGEESSLSISGGEINNSSVAAVALYSKGGTSISGLTLSGNKFGLYSFENPNTDDGSYSLTMSSSSVSGNSSFGLLACQETTSDPAGHHYQFETNDSLTDIYFKNVYVDGTGNTVSGAYTDGTSNLAGDFSSATSQTFECALDSASW